MVVDKTQHQRIVNVLSYDKRSSAGSSKGLALMRPVPELGLAAGDRIEPTQRVPDVSTIFHVKAFPAPIHFWRPSSETMTRHRNPLYDAELGVAPETHNTVDALHSVFLGVLKDFARDMLWAALGSDIWGTTGTFEEHLETALIAFMSELNRLYRGRVESGLHSSNLTQVQSFTTKMVGGNSDRKLKTKAAESYGVFLFLLSFFRKHSGTARLGPDAPRFLKAAEYLDEFCNIMTRSVWVMGMTECEALMNSWKGFCGVTHGWESLQTPKRHIVGHMVVMSWFLGNPRYYASWTGEGLNKMLKQCCRHQSQSTFEDVVLLSMPTCTQDYMRKQELRRLLFFL